MTRPLRLHFRPISVSYRMRQMQREYLHRTRRTAARQASLSDRAAPPASQTITPPPEMPAWRPPCYSFRMKAQPQRAPTLLEFCQHYRLDPIDDYVVWSGVGAVLTETGERKLLAATKQDPTLLRALNEAAGRQVATVLQQASLPDALRERGRALLAN